MRVKRIVHPAVIGCVALLVAGWCLALMMSTNKGQWPDTWPEELDAFRAQARTVQVMLPGIQEIEYEILFVDGDKFEAAWPHILAVKSEGAPLTLVRSPSKHLGASMDAGVRIHAPATGDVHPTPDGKQLKVGPPWPDDIKSEDGLLPAYVMEVDGKWVAVDERDVEKALEKTGLLYRARVDIELVVDGMVVDLNLIPLPANTPIIDRRFKKKAAPSD